MACLVCKCPDAVFVCVKCCDSLQGEHELGLSFPDVRGFEGERFPLGVVVVTWNAARALEKAGQRPWPLLSRHVRGDWGALLGRDDLRRNEEALRTGVRIFSKYADLAGRHYYVITEYDRSATTVMLPEDY